MTRICIALFVLALSTPAVAQTQGGIVPSTLMPPVIVFPSSFGCAGTAATGQVLTSGGAGVCGAWSSTPTVTSLTAPTIQSGSGNLNMKATGATAIVFNVNNADAMTFNGVTLSPTDATVALGGASNRFTTGSFSSAVTLGTTNLISGTAPTISSGFGSLPSVVVGGSAAFTVNVGTGGAATSGVIGLPTATNGWRVTCDDVTTQSSTVFQTRQIATSASSATIANFNTAGSQAAWVASNILVCNAVGY